MIFLLFLLLFIIGAPIYSLIAGMTLTSYSEAEIPLVVIILEFFNMSNIPMLLALPLFTLTGYLLAKSEAPKRLIYFSSTFFKLIPNNLIFLSLFLAIFFGAITGSSGITIIAFGSLVYSLLNDRFSDNYLYGFITTSGGLGLLFAPSLPMILYAIIAEIPVYDFFRFAIIPGTVLIVIFYLHSIFLSKGSIQNRDLNIKAPKNNKNIAMWLEVFLPIAVVITIYNGLLAITEIAAFAVLYIFIVEFFISKDLKKEDLIIAVQESMTLVGAIFIILGLSLASTNLIIDQQIPQLIFEYMSQIVGSKFSFFVFLIIFLLLIGAILDIYSAIIIVLPILLPLASLYEVNSIHLGILFILLMEIGFITPPIGLNLFIASNKFQKSITQIYISTIPFFVILLLFVLLVAYFPALFLLPH